MSLTAPCFRIPSSASSKSVIQGVVRALEEEKISRMTKGPGLLGTEEFSGLTISVLKLDNPEQTGTIGTLLTTWFCELLCVCLLINGDLWVST